MSLQITLGRTDDAMEDDRSSSSKPRVTITTRHATGGDSEQPRRSVKTKGRGFQSSFESAHEERYTGRGGKFESLDESGGNSGAQKCECACMAGKTTRCWLLLTERCQRGSNGSVSCHPFEALKL